MRSCRCSAEPETKTGTPAPASNASASTPTTTDSAAPVNLAVEIGKLKWTEDNESLADVMAFSSPIPEVIHPSSSFCCSLKGAWCHVKVMNYGRTHSHNTLSCLHFHLQSAFCKLPCIIAVLNVSLPSISDKKQTLMLVLWCKVDCRQNCVASSDGADR